MAEPQTDQFIAIAVRDDQREHADLVRLPPSTSPECVLPLEAGSAAWQASPVPGPKPTWDNLLDEQFRRVEPFLPNYAPDPMALRDIRPIERFAWRLETHADRQDFREVLAGGGGWDEVEIPHFGGPTGKATAFYRHVFEADPSLLDWPSVAVCFDGVDYIAEVYLNGRLVVRHEGFFAPFEAEIRPYLIPGPNVLVVVVHNDGVHKGVNTKISPQGEKLYAATGLGWDEPGFGWHHCPPGMGIYQPVRLEGRAALHISDLFVRTLSSRAEIEVRVEVTYRDAAMNPLGDTVPLSLSLAVDGGNFLSPGVFPESRQTVRDAGPNQNEYRFTLPIPDARAWSPDAPWLYRLTAGVYDRDDALCDERAIDFGIRTFVQDLENKPKGRFYLNDREVRLRGANTMGHEQQAVMAGDDTLLLKDLLIAKAASMNFLRLTQRPVQRRVYELADRVGLMIQSDLPLFGYLRRPKLGEAIRQAEEMERLVRRHPCVVQCSYINEPFPTPEDPETGEGTRQLTRPELESAFVAMTQVVRQLNPDRVVKPMDGDYHPPGPGQPDSHCYTLWYNGHGLPFSEMYAGRWQQTKPGWMMACGEFGAEGLDTVGLMQRRYPADWLPDPKNPERWTPWSIVRSQTPKMQPMFYPRPKGIEAWSVSSRAWQAEAVRLMAEAFRRIERINSTALHLLIDAWPAGWMKAAVDCERQPKPAFWAFREALAPVHAHATVTRKAYVVGEELAATLWLCNDTDEAMRDIELVYAVSIEGQTIASGSTRAEIGAMRSSPTGSIRVSLPEVSSIREGAVVVRQVVDGRCISETAESFRLWPEATPVAHEAVTTIDAAGAALSQTRLRSVRAELEAGGTVVVIGLPEGSHVLPGGDPVTVAPFSLEGAIFVEPDPHHPITADLPRDAFYAWHQPATGVFAELCRTVIRDEPGWTSILRSVGGAFWDGQYFEAHAAVERTVGSGPNPGRLVVCQIDLDRFAPTNPAARRLKANLTRTARAG